MPLFAFGANQAPLDYNNVAAAIYISEGNSSTAKLAQLDRKNLTGQAGLFLTPPAGTFFIGSSFDVSVVLDTKGASINTVEVELLFPPDKLQIANPSIGRSIIQVWPAAPIFSNREGKIYFLGGIPSPGVVTSQGVLLTFTFRVIAPGEAEMRFSDKTSVLANDGKGTNILGQRPSAFFKFQMPPPQGPLTSSPTHPDQEKWYKDFNPVFIWSRTQFADGYSFLIDKNPSGFPDATIDGTQSTVSYKNLENGIWYFHLRERSGGVWGGVSHYLVKIDNEPPASFRVNISPSKYTTSRNPIVRFFTTDSLSGLSHYEMKMIALAQGAINEAFFFEVNSPYQAVSLKPGRYQVVVRAVDGAANTRDETATIHIAGSFSQFINPEGIDLILFFVPWPAIIVLFGILLLIFIVILIALWKKHRHHLKHAFKEDWWGWRKLFSPLARFKDHGISIFLLFFIIGGVIWLIKHPVALEISGNAGKTGAAMPKVLSGSEFYESIGKLSRTYMAALLPEFMAAITGPIQSARPSFLSENFGGLAQRNAAGSGLSAPRINVAPQTYYPLEEVLYLEGQAPPKSKVDIIFEKTGSSPPVRTTADVNSNGEWFFSEKLELASGEWTVRARSFSGTNYSDWSNPRIIRSVVSGFVFGSLKVRYVPIAAVLLFLTLFSVSLFTYVIIRVRNLKNLEREKVLLEKAASLEKALHEKEKQVFEAAVGQDFSELRRRIMEELEHLDRKVRDGGFLSREESEHREKLLRELREAEESIHKKLKEM